MNWIIFLIFLSFNQTYFDAIYSLEKMPFDSATSLIYKEIKNTSDSGLCDIAINHSASKISSMSFEEFMDKISTIEKGLPYIDSIFEIYRNHYYVYDTLFANYLKLSLFTKSTDSINKQLLKLYREFKNRKDLVNVILFYATRYNAQKALKTILSETEYNFSNLNAPVLLSLARTFYNSRNYHKFGLVIKALSHKDLKGDDRIEFLKYKGFYFEIINNTDSALFYLIQYIESKGQMDISVARHLISLYIKNGDYEDAKNTVISLLKQSPFDYSLRKQAGYIYFMLEDYDSSLINYLLAKSLSKNDPDIYYYIARVLIRKHLYKDALASIKKAEQYGKRYSYTLLKAFILFKLNYLDDAARELLVWKNRGKSDPYYLYLTGLVLKGMGRKHLAYRYLKNSLKKDPTHPKKYIPLLSLATSFRDSLFVKMLVDTVKKLKLTDKDDIFDLAFAAQYIGYITLADSLYRELIAKYPNNPLYYNNLGYMWLEHGKLDKAEKYIKKAYELDPNDPYIIDSYAWLLYKKGKIDKAYKLSKIAMRKAKKDREIKEHYKTIKRALKERGKDI